MIYFKSILLSQCLVLQFGLICIRVSLVKLVNPLSYLCLKQGLVWQIKLVLCGIDIGIFGQREFHERVLFALAKQNAYGRLLELLPHITVVIVDIHLHLSKVLVAQLVSLEVNQHIALQQAVIEYEVNIIILLIEGESSLSLFKKEALSQLQQKLL